MKTKSANKTACYYNPVKSDHLCVWIIKSTMKKINLIDIPFFSIFLLSQSHVYLHLYHPKAFISGFLQAIYMYIWNNIVFQKLVLLSTGVNNHLLFYIKLHAMSTILSLAEKNMQTVFV